MFIARFKMNEIETTILLINDKFIIENVRQQRFVNSYVQNVVRYAKNANFITII